MDHVNMTVKNLDESVEFYKNLFGFEVKKEQPEDKSKIIGNNHIKLCLYEDPLMKPRGGIAHFGFHVENFNDILDICKSLGVKIFYDGPVQFEKSRSVYISDPSGYDIELSEIIGGGL
ncbi:glyoxalase/bleomycin resistance protein/dioxygenase [Candidatus Nitrosarchaeum limnium SFB1]|jgi:catechol 2,3-dioxygenase-like lactoylglutathione lyase family enzyme|uniref:Glyoxalase/bleomycin resistance protein/dioxygenase n=1 Tax=Candidatus Nitrosarchaeum limnium SFB1 TaxID=886738 RepID=F3KJU1_9ARCH|nr:glyoxalase/bleomycin resistance protein/dioxygenase [Candidatus Nitrosarchaeum limnium SFB1]